MITSTRTTRKFWVPLLLWFALLLLIAVVIGAIYGARVGLILFSVSLSILLLLQMWSLYQIEQWMDKPSGAGVHEDCSGMRSIGCRISGSRMSANAPRWPNNG